MRSLTVAFTTFQESVRQPAFYALLVMGVLLLVFSYAMPTFTLQSGEVKFVRDIGLGTFTLCVLLLGIFSSANLITTEIENKTAMTVMSKPLRRYEFIVGKYLGIIFAVAFLGALLATVFVAVVVAKVSGGEIVYQSSDVYSGIWPELRGIFPGLLLGAFEAFVLIAVSVALSTRLPMIINVSVSFALYVFANISAPLVDFISGKATDAPSLGLRAGLAVMKAAYYLLPNFQSSTESFSAIGLGKPVSANLVGWTVVYSVAYITAAVGAAVYLFQDRELG